MRVFGGAAFLKSFGLKRCDTNVSLFFQYDFRLTHLFLKQLVWLGFSSEFSEFLCLEHC